MVGCGRTSRECSLTCFVFYKSFKILVSASHGARGSEVAFRLYNVFSFMENQEESTILNFVISEFLGGNFAGLVSILQASQKSIREF